MSTQRQSEANGVARPLLLVEEDPDIREAIVALLVEQGYEVDAVYSPAAALSRLQTDTFALILTDLFPPYGPDGQDRLASAVALLQAANGTLVGVVTAWQVSPREAVARGMAFVVHKPFDIDVLVASVASALRAPLTPEQEEQAATVRAYFAALSVADSAAIERLCAPDLHYVAPRWQNAPVRLSSRQSYLTYVVRRHADFPAVRFEDIDISALPHGLVARYTIRWIGAGGTDVRQSGAAVFNFRGQLLAQIGLELHLESPHGTDEQQ